MLCSQALPLLASIFQVAAGEADAIFEVLQHEANLPVKMFSGGLSKSPCVCYATLLAHLGMQDVYRVQMFETDLKMFCHGVKGPALSSGKQTVGEKWRFNCASGWENTRCSRQTCKHKHMMLAQH